ncbi:MAG: peptidylprolyl isomerase, partial [Bacteroidales bacterium]|nr:peptidylprolyl isomerase [Bacteroidales bacterium]
VVETEFGFHIIQMIEKKGDLMNLRHILLKPKVSTAALEEAEKKANEVYELLKKDSISFNDAIKKYSNSDSKASNGKVVNLFEARNNPYYGSTRLTTNYVDPYTKMEYYTLKVGDYSKPFLTMDNKSMRVIKIVRLDLDVKEHKANLKDDYQELQNIALDDKNSKLIDNWVKSKVKEIYVRVDDEYKDCTFNVDCWIKK